MIVEKARNFSLLQWSSSHVIEDQQGFNLDIANCCTAHDL